ncbi:MFS transporter [Desulforhopalus singaporensis]|uniref:Sugar phosphate permease n=1 Tax=Desulforhopalus singaporensis TaxID=91360 RepID=A0A1H0RLR3_9BACT|nr:MFS transporter [Desulforhopalus singaporensis]SDP30443.1 Sugar phosphate permease [Desulforhopalus singaporensis]
MGTVSRDTDSARCGSFHYGWVVLAAGIAVMFACLGIGRFAIGMLLPSMGQALGLSYAQMGLISTANFAGYMASVLFAGTVAGRLGPRLVISLGLLAVGVSMALAGSAGGVLTVLVPYVITGIGSGLANVPMMGLVTAWFARQWRGRAAGFMLVGNGLGIVCSGLLIPQLNLQLGAGGWRAAWLVLGIVAVVISIGAGLLLKNDPQSLGCRPMGAVKERAGGGEKSFPATTKKEVRSRELIRLGIVYFLFGSSYAVYVTFIVTALVNERGFAEQTAGHFWSVVGVLSLFSGPLAGWISDKFGRRLALIIVFAQFTASYLLALAFLPLGCLYLSIALFGLSLWGIPTIMTAAVGDLAGPARAASLFGFITVFFGGGQIVGPAVAGWLAESTGRFSAAFLMCASLAAVALIVAAFLRIPPAVSTRDQPRC